MSKDKQVQQDTQHVNKPVQEKMKGLKTAVAPPIPSLQRADTDPRTLSPSDAQTLQRTIGNQALGQLIIQRKMTLGPVGDKYEQEADAVAKQVVGKLHAPQMQTTSAETTQRQEEEEEAVQMKPLPPISSLQRQEEEEVLQGKATTVQRQEEEDEIQMKPFMQRQEEEEELQMKSIAQRQEEEELQAKQDVMMNGGDLSGDIETAVQSAKSGGHQLDDIIRQPMEQAFEADFSNVKIHTDTQSNNLNQSIQARAFTTGQDIFFRQGEYNPHSSGGQELLAHELTHTIQQSGKKNPASEKEAVQRMEITSVATPRIQRVGIPQAGDDPPELKDLNARRYFSKLSLSKRRSIRKTILSDKKAASLATLAPLNKPSDDEANQLVKAFQDAVDTTTNDFPAYNTVWNDASLNTVPNNKRYAFINALFNQLKEGIEPKVRQLYKRLDKELDKRVKTLGSKVGKIPIENIRKKFATALKGMPGFKRFFQQVKSSGTVGKERNLLGKDINNWKDAGNLTQKIEEVAAEIGFNQRRNEIDNGNFSKKVQEADNFFRKLVESEELKKIPRPTIKVHLETAYDVDPRPRNLGGGFGGYQTDNEIHIGQDVFREVLIHEIGHYIENNLPSGKWQDIHLLMRARHGEAGGDGKLEAGQGARYKGAYPVTGNYTSRAYGGEGSTEMMAMTVQYLSQQANIETMVDNDPQQTAVIVRALRPREYAAHNPLRAFDDLLP